MAKIRLEKLPKPPPAYDARNQAAIIRIIEQAMRRVNYEESQDALAKQAMSWMAF